MRLALEVVGVPEVVAGLEGGVYRAMMRAYKSMGEEMVELSTYTKSAHLHGPTGPTTLRQRSGNLARSVTPEAIFEGPVVMGSVGIPKLSTAAKYARILHEGGTTRAHVIEARNAKMLRFVMDGHVVYRRSVNHPGSKFPARPYLTAALEEQAAQIVENIAAAIGGRASE